MYLFLFGRDPELSKLELRIYLETNGLKYTLVHTAYNFVIISFETEFPASIFHKIISDLGGTVRIAKVYCLTENIDDNFLGKLEFYYPKNFNYSITSLNLDTNDLAVVQSLTKKFFKQNRLKGVAKGTGEILDPGRYLSAKIAEGFEILAAKIDSTYYFCQTIVSTDPSAYEFKDNKRPAQKFTHGTSFRLAQIMVNLLGLEQGKTVVDPYCGIGTFLIEGMIKGYNVIGIDNDNKVLEAARLNIKWAIKEFGLTAGYKLIPGNSELTEFQAEGCVFEPYMGPFLKNIPTLNEAKEIANKLVQLYFKLFQNLNKNMPIGGKVVCILPYFSTTKAEIVDLDPNIYLENNFKLSHPPLEYNTPSGSKIMRRIYLLEKA